MLVVEKVKQLVDRGGRKLYPRFSLPLLRALIPAWQSLGVNEDAAKQRVNRVIAFSAIKGRHHFHADQIAVELFHPARP
jgi:hypothetical protein